MNKQKTKTKEPQTQKVQPHPPKAVFPLYPAPIHSSAEDLEYCIFCSIDGS